VLLAAGAYGSPQLLLLSGIGPADDLKMLQIEVRVNLPVGHNLQDHPVAGITLFTDVETLFTALKPENIDLLQKGGCGPLTSNVAEAGGFTRTRPGLSAPDVQYYFVPAMFHDEGLSAPFDHAFTIGSCLLKPTSRGKVSLRSARADAKPRILQNYFATEEDRQSIIQGIRMSMHLVRKAPLRDATRKPHLMPASDMDADIGSTLSASCRRAITPRARAPSAVS
jgi:choline dehydrogenase